MTTNPNLKYRICSSPVHFRRENQYLHVLSNVIDIIDMQVTENTGKLMTLVLRVTTLHFNYE